MVAMKYKSIGLCFGLLVLLLPAAALPAEDAQQESQAQPTAQAQAVASPQESPEEETTPQGQVVIEGRPILIVYEMVTGRTPDQRARAIGDRIKSVASQGGTSTESIVLERHAGWTEIVIGSQVIMAVTDTDAKMAGKPREELATEYSQSIGQAIQNYRHEHSWRMILRGILKTALTTLVLIPLIWVIRRVHFALRDRLERYIQTRAQLRQESAWHLAVAYVGPVALALGAFLRWLLIFAFLEAYLTVTLGFFSSTREVSLQVTKWVFSQLEFLAQSGLNYLPNLLIIAIIALVAHYVIRILRLIFSEIGKGNFKIRGFYPDWASPTERLIRMLVIVLALIVAFPYLPGAKSPAFKGISIFVGVLLSLGSSSAVANAIAGVILTYMRSFLDGDWVQIGDTTGEVIEKNLLVTRIRTPKAEVITIPNATVMSGTVKNYSTEAKKSGVIFHTTVSIGYDTPWPTVHQLLVNAALTTEHVLHQPAPFVLQQALNDFDVSYELNAYTNAPREVLNIFSDLHRNIQDKFNEAGVEICSPHFSALRDGNVTRMPEEYVKPDYKAPGFRVELNQADAKDGSPS
jgi:small-conductance mechanosensitive channel